MTAPIIWTSTGAKLLQSSLRDKDGVAFAKISDVTSGAAMVPESQSASFTAAAAKMYLTDTSASAFTATLPAGAANAQIRFIDSEQTWSTNNLTITPASGETIMGLSANESLICDVSGAWVELVWDPNGPWWTVTSNGAVNAATTEYISSGTAWDADDTGGNTIYGASGSLITGALSLDRVKLITFSTAPAPTDEIVIEFSNDGGTCWSPIGTASNGFAGPISTNITDASAGFSGAFYNSVTGNSINLVFGQYATIDPGGIGVDWESGTRWRVRKTSGRSVSYPEATATTAGLLPSYETGTFTPTYFGATTAGTTTYTLQSGQYVKMGGLVWFQLRVDWSNATGTGAALVGGLPFTCKNAANGHVPISVRLTAVTFSGSFIQAYVDPNTTQIEIESASSGTNASVVVETAGSFIMSGVYQVA